MLLAEFLGRWEVVLIIAVLLILLGVKKFPELLKGLGQGIDEAHVEGWFSIRVFVARGFGVGLIPFAPGTFGSLLGLLWFAMLIATGNLWAYLAGAIEGIAFSIWLCDDAEKILDEKDPSSVVLDEIIAIPFCFLPWVLSEWLRRGSLPPVEFFFTGQALLMSLGIIVLFRVFDIWKPWPVRQIQRLPGGWGVTADDLLAAVYVMLGTVFFFL